MSKNKEWWPGSVGFRTVGWATTEEDRRVVREIGRREKVTNLAALIRTALKTHLERHHPDLADGYTP